MMQILFFTIFAKIVYRSVLAEGNAYPRISGQGLEKETSNDCDVIITDQYGEIRSPGYPGKYPRYSRCNFSVKRFSQNTCEVKLTMEHFDLAKMTFSNCSADFLELQNGNSRYKLCGEMPTGSKRFVMFPENSDWLEFKFQSTFHQMKGFSIEVKQLPFSCKKAANSSMLERMLAPPAPCIHVVNTRTGRINFQSKLDNDGQRIEKCTFKIKKAHAQACVVELDFSRFEVTHSAGCETDYLLLPGGQRLCGILGGNKKSIQFLPESDELVLEYVSNGGKSNSFDMQISQLPGPCEHQIPSNKTSNTGNTLQQCDQILHHPRGRITSPGYPATFGPNFRCTYQIFRPDPSVCQIELEFLTFSLGKHNPPGCSSGSFLELPGRNRLCHDMDGKMILKVSEFKDPVVFYFRSDSRSSGRGFDIVTNQIPNTCPGYDAHPEFPNSLRRCYQEVTSPNGYFSSSDIHVRYPMRMPMWCEFVVRRAHPTICRLRLQITSRSFLNLPCNNNFIHLPSGDRMCISVTERRELWIPEGSNYVTLVYYNSNNPQFNLFVEQIEDSCKSDIGQGSRAKTRKWPWEISRP